MAERETAHTVANVNDELMGIFKNEVSRLAPAPPSGMTYGSHVTCPDCGTGYRVAIAGRKAAAISARMPCFRCWQKRTAANNQNQETALDQSETPTLQCYFIDDGDTQSYVAARHAGEALCVYVDLQGGDCDSSEFTVSLVSDEKIPDLKIQQSEDREQPQGYTLREALEKTRRGGRAEILSTSEF